MLALFYSGGKDSHFVLYKLITKYNTKPDYLLYIRPSRFSAHEFNEHLIILHSKLLNIPLIITNSKEIEQCLIKYNITEIIAADVLVEDHVKWLNSICKKLNINLIEPLLNYDTFELLKECILSNIEFIIIDTISNCKDLIGMIVNRNNLDKIIEIIKSCEIDWIGEFGEYHTIVVSSPIMSKKIQVINYKKYRYRNRIYIVINQFKLVNSIT